MTRFVSRILAALILAASVTTLSAAEASSADFKEVYNLLRDNLSGVAPAELDHAALSGLLNQFNGRVTLLTNTSSKSPGEELPPITRSVVLDDAYGYIRFGSCSGEAANAFGTAWEQLSATNKLKGLVVDLRYADGQDYAAAANVADRFLATEKTLLDWGAEPAKSHAKTNAISIPVMVLVNQQTSGAAEALAAVMHDSKIALLIGARTSGGAAVTKEFKLNDGSTLRIATTPIKVADSVTLTSQGLKPDIEVKVTTADERNYLNDPYKTNQVASSTSTNRARPRLNEAELVRLKSQGLQPEDDSPEAMHSDLDRPVVQDPALARALDLLKALAVVQRTRK